MRILTAVFSACIAIVAATALGDRAMSQDLPAQVVGVWKLVSFERKLASGAIIKPFGEAPSGKLIQTRGGHAMWVIMSENRKAPTGPVPTDAERIELFKSMLAAGGTYKIEGSKSVFHYELSSPQSATGKDVAYEVAVDGDRQTVTSPALKGPDGEFVLVSTWERVE